MRAKEHIVEYQSALTRGDTEQSAIGQIFAALNKEALETALTRAGTIRPSAHVLKGTLREQDQKWRKIARVLNLNPNGFREVLEEQGITF
jgi:hypothetical protein